MNDEFCELVLNTVLDKKAENAVIIDISKVSLMADYMLICSGRSKTHVQGIGNFVLEKTEEAKHKIFNIDGMNEGEWVLIDLGTVIVHIMLESVRNYYKLEKLWSHGKTVYFDEEYLLQAKKA